MNPLAALTLVTLALSYPPISLAGAELTTATQCLLGSPCRTSSILGFRIDSWREAFPPFGNTFLGIRLLLDRRGVGLIWGRGPEPSELLKRNGRSARKRVKEVLNTMAFGYLKSSLFPFSPLHRRGSHLRNLQTRCLYTHIYLRGKQRSERKELESKALGIYLKAGRVPGGRS